MIQRVIVTGGAKGIGAGISKVLGNNGLFVGMIGRDRNALDALKSAIEAAGGQAAHAAADLRDWSQIERAVNALAEVMGGVDALINNAGLVIRKSVFDLTLDEWRSMIETNVNGVFYATKAALPHLTRNAHSHIINVSSISGYFPLPGGSGYAASKYAVTGFSESLFQEVRDRGVKVTTVFPGSVDSESHRHDSGEDHSWKVKPVEVGQACLDALRTAPGCVISRVEIRPLGRLS